MKRMLYIQYTNPAAYPPLEHSSQILAESGWEILFLGVAIAGAEKLTFPRNAHIRVRSLGYPRSGWRQKIHYAAYCMWAIGCFFVWRPHWVYVSDSLACLPGWCISLFPWAKVIYHEHDLPSKDGGQLSNFMRFVLRCRTWLANSCTFAILPNQARAAHFIESTGTSGPVLKVWNCPSRTNVIDLAPHCMESELILVFAGSIVPARLQKAVLDAISMVPEPMKLRIIGYESALHPGYVEQLLAYARDLGIAEQIEYLGPVPHANLYRQLQECSIGLSLIPSHSADWNEQTMPGASNKPFDYLACGLPVIVSDDPAWKAMYVDTDCGTACNPKDPASIAAALQQYVSQREKIQQQGEVGRQRILGEWNYEAQFEEALSLLSQH